MAYHSNDMDGEQKNLILSQLFVQHGKIMYHQAKKILNDVFLAEDAVQMAFEKLEKYDFRLESLSSNKTRAFLVIIARNIAISIYNAKKNQGLSIDDNDLCTIPDEEALPLEMVINDENIQYLEGLIKKLSPTYADVLMLKYFSDYTISEIATLLAITEQSVRVRLYRGRKMLMDKLNERESYYEQARTE